MINRTNEPGTCLWCGKKCPTRKVYRYEMHQKFCEMTLAAQKKDHAFWLKHGYSSGADPREPKVDGIRQWEEKIDTGTREWVVDEWFHSQRCAWRFAQAAAKKGIRFTPSKQEKQL